MPVAVGGLPNKATLVFLTDNPSGRVPRHGDAPVIISVLNRFVGRHEGCLPGRNVQVMMDRLYPVRL